MRASSPDEVWSRYGVIVDTVAVERFVREGADKSSTSGRAASSCPVRCRHARVPLDQRGRQVRVEPFHPGCGLGPDRLEHHLQGRTRRSVREQGEGRTHLPGLCPMRAHGCCEPGRLLLHRLRACRPCRRERSQSGTRVGDGRLVIQPAHTRRSKSGPRLRAAGDDGVRRGIAADREVMGPSEQARRCTQSLSSTSRMPSRGTTTSTTCSARTSAAAWRCVRTTVCTCSIRGDRDLTGEDSCRSATWRLRTARDRAPLRHQCAVTESAVVGRCD
jgi:hypothetical protein